MAVFSASDIDTDFSPRKEATYYTGIFTRLDAVHSTPDLPIFGFTATSRT
jgi:hypothetical protein